MNPTEVRSTFKRSPNAEEQTTTGLLGSLPYMIVKLTEYGAHDRRGGRSYTIKHMIYVKNDQMQWVAASEQRSKEALISFGFIQEN
jgi:hypothetical protein